MLMAAWPIPPAALWISTFWPLRSWARLMRAWCEVLYTDCSEAASSKLTLSPMGTTREAGALRRLAKQQGSPVMTRSPTWDNSTDQNGFWLVGRP